MRLAALSAALLLVSATVAHARTPPVVVEVYTSQGCGPCVEANALVESLAGRADLIPLTFSVDYWDYLGWKDTFAKPEFAARQREYAARFSRRSVFTPQVVIDGRVQARATDSEKIDDLIDEAVSAPRDQPDIEFTADRVAVGSGRWRGEPADVWLIRYDPRGREVEIKRGDNRGKTVTYRNVVRELVRLGEWKGRPVSFRLPKPADDGLETLVVVQQSSGGRVLARLSD